MAAVAVAITGVMFTATSAVAEPAPAHSTVLPAGQTHKSAPSTVTPAAVVVPAAYNNACGSGYGVIDYLPLPAGNVYLTYNSSTGYNCVATVRDKSGAAIPMGAAIAIWGVPSSYTEDRGNYATYAGPVYLHAAGKCIDWGGWIGNAQNSQDDSHCG